MVKYDDIRKLKRLEKEKQLMADVNSPSHYNSTNTETIDIIHETMTDIEFHGYLKGNIIKYVCRYKHKHKEEPVKDLMKAQWYLEKLIEVLRKSW